MPEQPPDLSSGDKSKPPVFPSTRIFSLLTLRPRLAQAERGLGLIGGLGLLVLIGTLLLWLPISGADDPLTLNEAFFTAVSAVATTGLTVITIGQDLSLFGQIVLLLLMQLGGIGFMVMAVTVFRLVGKRVTFAERLTLRDSLGLVSAGQILNLSKIILLSVIAIELIGAFILWLVWSPVYGGGRAAYYAIFHSVSAFTNASFDLFAGSPTAAAGFPTDPVTLLTLSSLIFLGGIGIPVISDLIRYRHRRRLSLHSRIILITSAILIIAGTILFFLAEYKFRGVFADESPAELVLLSFFHSVASRTSGFTVTAQFSQLEPANAFLLTILMFIGASPASMGGGITTSTFAVLLLTMWSFVRGHKEIKAGRRVVPLENLYKAGAIVTAAGLIVALTTWLLLYSQQNVSLSEALVESVSAFSTSGYSIGLTQRLNLFGQFLVAGVMFFGRIGMLTIIVALGQPRVPTAASYPEEGVLIG